MKAVAYHGKRDVRVDDVAILGHEPIGIVERRRG
jgi:threonine dehydrogenase-like Zn-dependent dehydrogenase